MRDDWPGDDPRRIWQEQPVERTEMTLEKLRQKARNLRAGTRRQSSGTLAGPLVACFFYVFAAKQFRQLMPVLQPLLAFTLAWSLAGLYFLNRRMWPAAMPGDMGFSTGLEFCRREIERRRYFLGRVLLWSFGPILLSIGTFIFALAMIAGKNRALLPNGLPFLTLVIAWIAGYFVMRVREKRQLQRELDELNEIERQNS